MAVPRVFLSSTCYDLSEVRDALSSLIRTFGFEPCLSDRGDVFYHPDLHTHESCVNEVSNCQLFVLLIGGRFGGNYIADASKSIVNAEYAAARELKIPVFAFVKREVLDEHRFYKKNKNNAEALRQLDFPSIEKREYVDQIFQFIDDVRLAAVNNGFFPFDYARDVEQLLRKQWAGLFFGLLQQRRIDDERKAQGKLLSDLTSATGQLNDIVKKMYRHLDATHADTVIEEAEDRSKAQQFFRDVFAYFQGTGFIHTTTDTLLSINAKRDWYDFLAATSDFDILEATTDDDQVTDILVYQSNRICISVRGAITQDEKKISREYQENFDAFTNLPEAEKREVLQPFVIGDLF